MDISQLRTYVAPFPQLGFWEVSISRNSITLHYPEEESGRLRRTRIVERMSLGELRKHIHADGVAIFQEMLEADAERKAAGGRTSFELLLPRKDQVFRWYRFQIVNSLSLGSTAPEVIGTFYECHPTAYDILSRNKESYKAALRVAPFGTFVITQDRFSFANKPFLTTLGLPELNSEVEFEALGLPSDHICPSSLSDFNSAIESSFRMPLESELSKSIPICRFINKQHQEVDCHVVVRKILWKEEEESILGFVTDLTKIRDDERRLRRAESQVNSKTASLEEIGRAIRHDLGTPLATLSGQVALIKSGIKSSDHKLVERKLDETRQTIRRIKEMLDGLASFLGDPEDKRRKKRRLNFAEETERVLRDTAEVIFQFERAHNRKLTILVRRSTLPTIEALPGHYASVLQNLLTNAIRYMDPRETNPRIEIFGTSFQEGYSTICVADNGVGIDEDKLERVFNLYYKTDAASEGTGVGLAVVKRVIENYGGRIWIEKNPPKGTRVYFTVPEITTGDELDNE